jgi:DNA mismatch repair protein PMS2
LPLDLPADDEMVVMDNLDIFKKNGFEFLIDEEKPPTQIVHMLAHPYSKQTVFGVQGNK